MIRLLQIPIALSLCVALPGVALAQVPPPPSGAAPAPAPDPAPAPEDAGLTEDEKLEKAKGLYVKAEGLAQAGDWAAAVPNYEAAYQLVPGKHGFAHKVGVAAWNAKDCNKADEYMKHFVNYADPEKYADKIAEAKQIIAEIAISGCATTAPVAVTPTPAAGPVDEEENPLSDVRSTSDMRDDEAAEARDEADSSTNGLLIGGIVLGVVGLAGLGLGVGANIAAKNTATQLAELSSNDTNTGFPQGDYSSAADDAPYNLEGKLKTRNMLTPIGYAAGGLFLAGGALLIILHMKRNGSSANAKAPAGPTMTGLGPSLLPGGAGASASFRF